MFPARPPRDVAMVNCQKIISSELEEDGVHIAMLLLGISEPPRD